MTDDLRNVSASKPPRLQVLSAESHIVPTVPIKRIHDGEDLSFFLRTKAYADIMTFLLQLNRAMVPEKGPGGLDSVNAWPMDSPAIPLSPNVKKIGSLIQSLKSLMASAPPETGPRRFGNAAFRTWFAAAQHSVPNLLKETLSSTVWEHALGDARQTLEKELESYLLGSFGSSERLDYGTGHELSFLAFLGCIWKLGGFAQSAPGVEERAIVVGIIQPYLELVRALILTYTLEPAGSHGVWGLDDHSFLPYILGSAQYAPPVQPGYSLPTEGSLQGAPAPERIAKRDAVEQYRSTNLYFSAIGFIFDVKSGPFWEHSPTLYDISGIKAGWAKINKGMIKMYNAEVLSKFPVVQHFPFGTLFSWEAHPDAIAPTQSPHVGAQPQKDSMPASGMAQPSARAPWASTSTGPTQTLAGTAAPWARPSAVAPRTGSQFGRTPNRMPMTANATPLRSPRDAVHQLPTTKPSPDDD
ncbi:serine/threonine-protein phosphatase 2A activator 1 [Delphinella strobiligena]|nr:serine/threonine-protein phosphatase 2A activator 1 [Delphinella strobiligena]